MVEKRPSRRRFLKHAAVGSVVAIVGFAVAGYFLLTHQLQGSFGIYVLENNKLVISDEDIVWYSRATHEIRLTELGAKKDANGNYETEWFGCFGFTTLSGTRSLPDTLESRAIIHRMSRNVRPVERFNPNDPELDRLRGQLLKYRLDSFNKTLPEIDFANVTTNDRLIELFTPLLQVAPKSKHQNLLECLKGISADRKEEDESGFEPQLLKAILSIQETAQNNRLKIRDVTDAFNLELPLNEHWKIRQVRGLCRKLGLKDARYPDHDQSKGILLEPQNLVRQCRRYGLVYPLKVDKPPIPPSSVDSVDWSTAVNDPKNEGNRGDFTLDSDRRPVDPSDPFPEYKPLIQRNYEAEVVTHD